MDQEAFTRLTRDLQKAVKTMTATEARFLVDAYYIQQENRIRADGQIRSMEREPHEVLRWISGNTGSLEAQLKAALQRFAESQHMGRWALAVKGIGPVIAAGLIAHIDITKAPTVGHIWRFAGLDPTSKWKKGEKRPWNADLKTLCWKIGESFVKVKFYDDAFYAKFYVERKKFEWERNLAGGNAEAANLALISKNFRDDSGAKAWYEGRVDRNWAADLIAKGEAFPMKPKLIKEGEPLFPMLPPKQIHMRAARYATKVFLSHWHAEAYRHHYKTEPPLPYPIAHLGHAHIIHPPKAA